MDDKNRFHIECHTTKCCLFFPVLHNGDIPEAMPSPSFSLFFLFQTIILRYYWDNAFLMERPICGLCLCRRSSAPLICANYGKGLRSISFPRNVSILLLIASWIASWNTSAPSANGSSKLYFPISFVFLVSSGYSFFLFSLFFLLHFFFSSGLEHL